VAAVKKKRWCYEDSIGAIVGRISSALSKRYADGGHMETSWV